jgi:hypothetical protein
MFRDEVIDSIVYIVSSLVLVSLVARVVRVGGGEGLVNDVN